MRIFLYIVSDYKAGKAGYMGITFTTTDTSRNLIIVNFKCQYSNLAAKSSCYHKNLCENYQNVVLYPTVVTHTQLTLVSCAGMLCLHILLL